MFRLLLASRNRGKTREFSQVLGEAFEVRDLTDEKEIPAIEETGSTFVENAILKATAMSERFPEVVVGDDSGLEVDALQGGPGIYSARYAGENASDRENVAKLLAELAQQPGRAPYSARFRCVLALARQGKILGTFEGVVEGSIVARPRGDGGFGYDPVFQPLGLTQTFAELPSSQKNEISHRGKAIRALQTALLA